MQSQGYEVRSCLFGCSRGKVGIFEDHFHQLEVKTSNKSTRNLSAVFKFSLFGPQNSPLCDMAICMANRQQVWFQRGPSGLILVEVGKDKQQRDRSSFLRMLDGAGVVRRAKIRVRFSSEGSFRPVHK